MALVERTFGGFNPRFLGASLRFDSSESVQTFLSYFFTSEPEDSRSLMEVFRRSALEHEVRHYHDFLVTPFSGALFGLRYQSIVNGTQAIHRLADAAGNSLPVPLSAWIALSRSERDEYVAELNELFPRGDGAPWEPVDVDEVAAWKRISRADLIRHTVDAYQQTSELLVEPGNPEAYLCPANYYEVAALAVQAHAIWQGQGEDAAAVFLQHLEDAPSGPARTWRALHSILLRARLPSDLDHMIALAIWCLVGNPMLAEDRPQARLLRLVSRLSELSRVIAPSSAHLWDRLDALVGCTPWRDGLTGTLQATQRRVVRYGQIAQQWGPGFNTLRWNFERYATAQRSIVDVVLGDLDLYIDPTRYLNAAPGTFQMPIIDHSFDGVGISHTALREIPELLPVIVHTLPTGDEVCTRYLMNLPADVDNTVQQMLATEQIMLLVDFAFSTEYVDEVQRSGLRSALEMVVGKRVFFVV